jgi:hypothetical protein
VTWSTDRQTLDPGITRITLAGRAQPEAHYVQVRAWERKRRRQRWLANLGSGLVLVFALAGAVVLLSALAGCTLSDCKRVGAAGWECRARVGTAVVERP